MFGLTKRGPSQPTGPFAHADGCKLVVTDPDFEPEWQEVETGHWRRTCQCWAEDVYESRGEPRTRQDPYDPSTFGHAPYCEHRDVTDPAIVKALLTVVEREIYWAVTCGTCQHIWQTAFYAAESAE
jgi:hypothetical protein